MAISDKQRLEVLGKYLPKELLQFYLYALYDCDPIYLDDEYIKILYGKETADPKLVAEGLANALVVLVRSILDKEVIVE